MSVLSYLDDISQKLVLSSKEKANIDTSITTLYNRLQAHFGDEVKEHFRFGSSTRGTILPRKADSNSDIDYMIVFDNEADYDPQTFIDRLKRFAQKYYKSSQIKQSHPTVVLELNHIKFDLVPAYKTTSWLYGDKLYIPAPKSGFTKWMETNPNDFNAELSEKNKNNSNLIKPMIRLVKYWNAENGHVYDSYGLEKILITNSYWWSCANLKDYFFKAINDLPTADLPQYKIDKVERAKNTVQQVKDFEKEDMPVSAEIEVKNLTPTLKD